MASKFYIQTCSDGRKKKIKRNKQGRKPSGLGKLKSIRLWKEDEEKLMNLRNIYGEYWNENEFIRDAVSEKLYNSVYTELLIH
ncbi:MAG: hypothetical protein A2390_02225 [Candidatus Liptonbacteria bacterium RIFOXYB1_FULL_36_10]|uniref:Uncharacterized protein n=1 Tax=Candidatus Liptonbacteria bacterium RIFOXYB1_FULL_36_10 TaxID=1798654 RepID=A0A1G2CNI2_9BACT|nr:MAG: hypothetical protein A2390_02225 [Candidatus Liptonbacteria bacterium RIFOXYB1_FULL_36_10]